MKKITLVLLALLNLNLPAQEYFQQEVNYIIDVTLDDKNHTLDGTVHIDYFNNSPNDLDFLWFHIWPNAYKDNSTALFKQNLELGEKNGYYSTEQERGFINGLDFKVNGKRVKWDYHPEHIDICKIFLNKPLRAGQSIRISTPFFVKIPDAKFSRLGHVDQSYMITQWYPKPAVFDKNGWHEMPYLNLGEFYSEFGSFDVSITLPSNYTVGATGDLQNPEEIARLNKLAKITDTISKFGKDMSFPVSDLTTKTLRYIQKNVHDFGWFADKRYHVLKGEVEVPYTKEKVTLWTMFTNNEADLWENSIEYMHDAVYYYSLWNGDYPYKHCTAVDGTIAAGGGMEYPNVTIIGESGNAKALEEVIMHEVGHNWFYGMLGSNERDHPWMDEGINSHHELRYMRKKYPEYNMLLDGLPKKVKKILDLEDYSNKQIAGEIMYLMHAWTGKDQPIELHSADYLPLNYWGIVYSKTAIV
ncbi:MAG: M1 family metallopeptidase, partial [Bacteroidota bacterium]|nr:M1 family metallopeptidase [Bacteroidota bacterium]